MWESAKEHGCQPQAQEAAIANTIPQTATVPRTNGPKFTPTFDGAPQWAPIAGTSMSYVRNSSEPIIQTGPGAYYAVVAKSSVGRPQVTDFVNWLKEESKKEPR